MGKKAARGEKWVERQIHRAVEPVSIGYIAYSYRVLKPGTMGSRACKYRALKPVATASRRLYMHRVPR
jgi:hypothetical protein